MSLSEKTERQIAATKGYLVQNGIEPGFGDTLLSHYADLAREADAEIERLRASLAEAVGVLRPFGECARYFDAATNPMPDSIALNHSVTLGDMREARDFITKHGGGS